MTLGVLLAAYVKLDARIERIERWLAFAKVKRHRLAKAIADRAPGPYQLPDGRTVILVRTRGGGAFLRVPYGPHKARAA